MGILDNLEAYLELEDSDQELTEDTDRPHFVCGTSIQH